MVTLTIKAPFIYYQHILANIVVKKTTIIVFFLKIRF
jgi:hypothetical protein